MTMSDETAPKTHYICQTYIEKKSARGGPVGIQVDKQFQYTSEAQAQERAERENRSDACIGADAYMVVEDPASGEESSPVFIVRLGTVPEFDAF